MPIPGWVAKVNRRVANPAMRTVTGRARYFGTVIHVGRKSGQTYYTPVNVYPTGDSDLVALTYGSSVDWLANVEAAGECRIRHRGKIVWLVDPTRISESEALPELPATIRGALKALNVHEFVKLKER